MKEQKIVIYGLNINYKEAGIGPVILILHGWGVGSWHWAKVQEILAQNGLKVIVPDLPGFGKSDPPKEPWNVDGYANFILEFSEKLGLDKFYLLGHSFGGRIATKFAAYWQQKLLGLILVDSAGVTPRNKVRIFIYQVLTKIGNLIFSLPVLSFFRPLARKFIYWASEAPDFYQAKGIMREVLKKVVPEDLTPYLEKIKTPTLIIWGKNDKMCPVSDAYLIHKKITQSRLEIIPDIGHSPNLSAPEILANIILNFLNSFRR